MAAFPAKSRLETWKEVAAFFGRDESTVKRWEAERGLPVHRLPGGTRSRIYALRSELEAWLTEPRAAKGEAEEVSAADRSSRTFSRLRIGLSAALGAAILLIVVALSGRGVGEPGATHRAATGPVPLEAQRLYVAAMDDWAHRTPESLTRAVDELRRALILDPDYAEAYAGLAKCYNLMREFTLMPASQAYPLARAAAEHAVALDDDLAEAHASLAFIDFYWSWDARAAEREFQRALALDPRSATTRQWHATFLAATGNFAGALTEIDRAAALDPASLSIRADRGAILLDAGRTAEATQLLTTVERADPAFLSPHNYLAHIYLTEGRSGDYLREAELAARLTDDRQRDALLGAAARGFGSSGREGMLSAMLAEQLDQYLHGVGLAYHVAETYALLGRQPQALAYLQIALDRREAPVTTLAIDPALRSLASAPEFQADVRRIRPLA